MAEEETPPSRADEPDVAARRASMELALELWEREDDVSVKRICATNFRAFRELTLEPGNLTALVGANAAGKSSVIDLFTFLSDCLSLSLYTALERRGGLRAVRHTAPGGRPRNVSVSIDLDFGEGYGSRYAFSINAQRGGTYTVAEETCRIWAGSEEIDSLALRRGEVVEMPRYLRVRDLDDAALALPVVGAIPAFSPVLDALRNLRSYSIVPDKLREFQDSEEGQRLAFDGGNAASVLRRLAPEDRTDLIEMLAYVVPGIVNVRTVSRGNKLTLEFAQESERGRSRFEALQMSDGTLRLLGLLLALYQKSRPRFVAIEEPEATIHVAALRALMEVFQARAEGTQILLSTHSAEVLDSLDIENVYYVAAEDGYSRLSELSAESRSAVRDALFSPGELLRSGELHPA